MIFDEPTNHLDIVSIEALEEGLADYQGTLLVVSHDRDFLDTVVNHIFEISWHQLNRFLGNYSYYAEKSGETAAPVKTTSPEKKAQYEEFKEKGRRRSRYKKRLTTLRETIENLEAQYAGLEKEQLTVDGADWQRLNDIADMRKDLEERILELYIEKEQLEEEPPVE